MARHSVKTLLRRGWVIAGLAAVLTGALLGALAVIPHVHGHDLDHSRHKTCPIYQKGIHSGDGVVSDEKPLGAQVFFVSVILADEEAIQSYFSLQVRSRGPPRA